MLRERSMDVDEFLEIEWVTLGWMMDELRAGRLPDVKTQIAVHWLDRLYSGQWPWPAFDQSSPVPAASFAQARMSATQGGKRKIRGQAAEDG